jgi:F-type H+-transporting ATPase subunit gamma
MANRRELVKRRKAVRNIRKITRTMQLISTARFQASRKRAVEGRPYVDKMTELVADLARASRDLDHPLMRVPEAPRRALLVVLTSNRGLCGSYNANVLRTAIHWIDDQRTKGLEPEVWMAGRKGMSYFRFVGRQVDETVTGVSEKPGFGEVLPLADRLMDNFLDGRADAVSVAYMKFLSASRQQPVVESMLPLTAPTGDADEEPAGRREIEYEFLPNARDLLDELLPAKVRVQLFQAFNDATLSEHVARMVAMKSATDAADEMNKMLTRQYNRARQTAITMELLDIVGGANALA